MKKLIFILLLFPTLLMGQRYFVGGSGALNWNDTSNWSASDGGVSGASVPTLTDDVYFNANSLSGACTLTIDAVANCLDLDFTGLDEALAIVSSVYSMNVYGSLTLATNLTWTNTGTAYLYMKATTSETITMNGIEPSWNYLYFDGVGGTWTNQDDMTMQGSVVIWLDNGTWTTNDFDITSDNLYITSLTTSAKTLNLGSSTISNLRWLYGSRTGAVLNAGTSTLNVTNNNSFGEGAQDYYNVNFIGATSNRITSDEAGSFYNVSVNTPEFKISGTGFEIINSLTLTGLNGTDERLIIQSEDLGTPTTITCNGIIIAENVDFQDIDLVINKRHSAKELTALRSSVTGADFYLFNSIDYGGNDGFTFTRLVETKQGDKLPFAFRESFEDSPVNATHPIGWTQGTGSYAVKELSAESGLPYFNVGDKYLECTSAGAIAVQSNTAVGSWEFSVYKSGNDLLISFISDAISGPWSFSGYTFWMASDRSIRLTKSNGTTNINLLVTSTSYFNNDIFYDIKIARSSLGVFTVYIRGGAFGDNYVLINTSGGFGTNPVTDNTYTTSQFFILDFDAGDKVSNIVIK